MWESWLYECPPKPATCETVHFRQGLQTPPCYLGHRTLSCIEHCFLFCSPSTSVSRGGMRSAPREASTWPTPSSTSADIMRFAGWFPDLKVNPAGERLEHQGCEHLLTNDNTSTPNWLIRTDLTAPFLRKSQNWNMDFLVDFQKMTSTTARFLRTAVDLGKRFADPK